MSLIGDFFDIILKFCYGLCNNLGVAIILFTLVTKVVLLPISIIVQKNSISMVKMYPDMYRIKTKFFGNKEMIAEEQYKLYKKNKYNPLLDLIPVVIQLVILMGIVNIFYRPMSYNMDFLCFDLSKIPGKEKGISLLIPAIAAFSAWLMCFTQNISNVLQSEQNKLNKYSTITLSVGLSLYLGLFVSEGIGLYWIFSNLFSIALMYILNAFIPPKKYVDYKALKETRDEYNKLVESDKQEQKKRDKNELIREKTDFKRFEKFGTKQLVFYSERNGFYKYFKDVIDIILEKTNIKIHYVTNDYHDEVLKLESDRFKTYYIGEKKFIITMMKMDADMVIMTTPDLQKYHIKKSLIRNDIEYIYMDHGIGSINLMLRKGALDHFDTVFATNEKFTAEIEGQDKLYGIKRNIVKFGLPLIDNMIRAYNESEKSKNISSEKKTVLIAPSWQEDNILDSCIEELIDNIVDQNYNIIVRPHPQFIKHCEGRVKTLKEKYKDYDNFLMQTDFSSNSTVFEADVLISDWSSIVFEYTFTTLKPVLYINTPMKIMNPDYKDINVVPLDIEVRDAMGISLNLDEINKVNESVSRLINDEKFSKENMAKLREKYLYNIGNSAMVGAVYIINRLIEISKKN